MLDLVEKGAIAAEDARLRDRLVGLKLQRDEFAHDIADWQKRLSAGDPAITPERIERLATLLKDKLHNGAPELGQAYARLMMDEVSVKHDEIRIGGSKTVLARCASEDIGETTPAVLSFVRK